MDELLTGRPPFDPKQFAQAGLDEILRRIREEEPQKPSTCLRTLQQGELTTTAQRRQTEPPRLIHQVRGDLDWIVMKCLEKNRARRYETANGLASDIEHHLKHEPVSAAAPGALYRFQKFVQRNRAALATASALVLLLASGVVVSTWQATLATRARKVAETARAAETRERLAAQAAQRQAEEERSRADEQRQRAERNLYTAVQPLPDQRHAPLHHRAGAVAEREQVLSAAPDQPVNHEQDDRDSVMDAAVDRAKAGV